MQPIEIKLAKRAKILIVEDDAQQMRLLVKHICQALDCDILEAMDGLAALRIMLKDNQIPDLILLDLMLPYLSGVEFLTVVRGRTEFQEIPVVVCTAISDRSEIKARIARNIHSYLVKPIRREKLLEKVLDALRPIRFRVDYC